MIWVNCWYKVQLKSFKVYGLDRYFLVDNVMLVLLICIGVNGFEQDSKVV